MARMVGYKCEKCGKKDEEIFNDTEKKPEKLKRKCKCGGTLLKADRKDNLHRWSYMDRGGI